MMPAGIKPRYKCSTHNVWLIPAFLKVWYPRKGRRTVIYFKCPIRGCGYAKPYKYQRTKPVTE